MENGLRCAALLLLAGVLAIAWITGTAAAATAMARSGEREEGAWRVACWVRVALRRGLVFWRGTLATATLAAVTAAACSAGPAELFGLVAARTGLEVLALATTGVSSGICWRTMNSATTATEAASAPPPHLARRLLLRA